MVQKNELVESGGSRIAVCSWSLQPDGPAHLIESLDRINIKGVQLALNPLVENESLWRGAIDFIRHAQREIVSGMIGMKGEYYSTLESIKRTGGVRLDEHWEENKKNAKKIAFLAGHAGIELVTFHGGFLPHEKNDSLRKTMIDRIRAITDIFGEHNVNIALETGQESADTLLDVLADLDHENIGVNFDPANMILYGMGDPVDALRKLSNHVRQIHVKDALPTKTPGEWGTEMPVGDGAVNWPAFFEVAESLDPAVCYVIERESGDDRIGDVRKARDLIEEHVASGVESKSR